MKKLIYTRNEQKIIIELPPPSHIQSFFVFTLHKSGSVLLESLLQDICASLNISMFGFENALFDQGYGDGFIHLSQKDVKEIFAHKGYCYHGFRALPSYLDNFDFNNLKKILLIRDPRDILVSYYFSMRKSHYMTQGEAGNHLLEQRQRANEIDIDEYVLQQVPFFREVFRKYERIEGCLFKLFKYEDVIFNKYQWICDILNFLSLELDDCKIIEIANKHDIFPSQEDSSSHVRRVIPGDHTRKLKPDTIKLLNEYFEDILIKYGYAFDGRDVERQALEIYFNQSQKRIQVLEEQLNQSRFEAARSQTQLENVHLELQQIQEYLQIVQPKLQQPQEQLQTVQPKFQRPQEHLQSTQLELQHSQEQLQAVQLELGQSQEQLQATQFKLEQSQKQLQPVELELKQTQKQLQAVQLELERSQNQARRLQAKTQRQRKKISKLTTSLKDVHAEISAIKKGKFWRLWSASLKLKSWLRLK